MQYPFKKTALYAYDVIYIRIFLLGAIFAGMFFVWLIVPELFDAGKIVTIAIIATIAEGVSPKEVDNITIPVAVILAASFL